MGRDEMIVTADSAEDMLRGKWRTMAGLVRCKDCKYYYAWDAPLVGGFCLHNSVPMINIEPMHYCSWGEIREDETD